MKERERELVRGGDRVRESVKGGDRVRERVSESNYKNLFSYTRIKLYLRRGFYWAGGLTKKFPRSDSG